MTDADLLTLIKGSDAFKALADAGRDNELADAINASLQAAVPVTVTALAGAAPNTLATIAGGSNPMSEMEVIASRVRAEDAAGIGQWATTLLMLQKMSQAEHDAVEALVSAAAPPDTVSHQQVSSVLNAIRPRGHLDDAGNFTADPSGSPRSVPITWPS